MPQKHPYITMLQQGDGASLRTLLDDTPSIARSFPIHSLGATDMIWGGSVDADSGAVLREVVMTVANTPDPYDPLSYAIRAFSATATDMHARQRCLHALVIDALTLPPSLQTYGACGIIDGLVYADLTTTALMQEGHPTLYDNLYTIIAQALTPETLAARFATSLARGDLTLQHCAVALMAHGPTVLPHLQPLIHRAYTTQAFAFLSCKEDALLQAWAVGSSHTRLRLLGAITPDLRKEPPYEVIGTLADHISVDNPATSS